MSVFRQVMDRLSPGGTQSRLSTLIFHRVLSRPDPLFVDETDAARFTAICEWISKWFNVLPLDSAVERLEAHALPSRALAITFDDGYADNHDVALPILSRFGLPATFFIATGFLDGGRMWNDTVIEAIRQCHQPAVNLSPLGIDGLGTLPLADAAQRRMAIDTILGAIKYMPTDSRRELTLRIGSMCNATLPNDLMMTSEQVRGLRRAGMQIGAHTVSHPILAGLADDEARTEVLSSKQRLEQILGDPVTLFAYPNGKPGTDFTDNSVSIARDVGFRAAVSTAKGTADSKTDLFRIPRYTPWQRSKLRFGAQLAANLWSAAA